VTPEQRLDELERQVRELERRVSDLDRWTLRPNRFNDPTPKTIPVPQCPKCHISLTGVMSYTCSQKDCPTGLGPVWCQSSTYK
jgi:hypothetical protein